MSLALARIGVTAVALGVVLAVAAGCASAASRFDGPDGDRLLYEARCGLCHVPFAPTDVHPEDWPGVVDEMGPRAGLNAALRARVLAYVLAAAKSPVK